MHKALPNNQILVGFLTISSNVFIIQKIFFYNTYFRSTANGIYHSFGIIIFNIEFFYIFFIILQSRARLQKCLASLFNSWPGKISNRHKQTSIGVQFIHSYLYYPFYYNSRVHLSSPRGMSYYMTECVQTYFVKTPHLFINEGTRAFFFIEYRHVHTISYNEDRIHFEEIDMNAYCHSFFFLQKHV